LQNGIHVKCFEDRLRTMEEMSNKEGMEKMGIIEVGKVL